MRIALLLALAALLATPALAAEPAPTITVTGRGEVRAAPDRLHLSAGVETRAETAAGALAANAQAMTRVIEALLDAGLARRAIATGGLSVQPVDGRDSGGRSTGEIDHFRVVNTVRLTTGAIDRAGALIDALAQAGANRFGGLSFALADPGPLRAEARAEAMADARAAAEAYAAAEGLAPGAVKTIRETGAGMPAPRMRGMALEAADAPPTPVEPGEIAVSASVTVVWTLVPAE